MSDIVDKASEREAEMLSDALADHRRRTAQASAGQADCEECEDCGCNIPAARRAALPHATRCVECQARFEWAKKMMGT